MAVKKCCIDNCKSCSTRKEDAGVTYHKFPKNMSLKSAWASVTRCTIKDEPTYVCSRHFRKTDFQIYKDSKYILKSDAIPSIFSWNKKTKKMDDTESKPPATETVPENSINEMKMSPEPEESLEAIRKYIETQEKEIQDIENEMKKCQNKQPDVTSLTAIERDVASTSNLMNILDDTDEKGFSKNDKEINKINAPIDKGNGSVALSVGSKVEARDFAYNWHSALIKEVDFDEMEVLVHYDQDSTGIVKHDEWISVNSPRLRPFGMVTKSTSDEKPNTGNIESKEVKDDKPKPTFVEGERCLARWRDNKRFMATIQKVLGNGAYEIVFDDGFLWKCSTSRLYKWKPGKCDSLTVETNLNSPTTSLNSPIQTGGPINSTGLPNPAYNSHLFDPKRDYLTSKLERREMKRKLNIKEIFNIGQKRPKMQKDKSKELPKKPKIIKKKNVVETAVEKNVEKANVKTEIPDAVASIIGTLNKNEETEVKTEDIKQEDEDATKSDISDEVNTNVSTPVGSPKHNSTLDSDGYKSDFDPVVKEEVKLEKFEKIDDSKHEEVIDRIKEVINKLEDGLNYEKPATPKHITSKTSTPKCSTPKPSTPKPSTPKPEINEETPTAIPEDVSTIETKTEGQDDNTTATDTDISGLSVDNITEEKVAVKEEVEKARCELKVMKKQMKRMRKEMLKKTQHLLMTQLPDSFMLPGEWCCKWVDGQPVGTVSEIAGDTKLDADGKPGLPRRSVQVEDKRLPPGWTKHMVRRSLGHSAGKWDVVLVSPNNRRFHTKTDMRNFLENNNDESLKPYENALLDFGLHLKLSSRLGWITHTPEGVAQGPSQTSGALSVTSPIVKRNKKLKGIQDKNKKRFTLKLKIPRMKIAETNDEVVDTSVVSEEVPLNEPAPEQEVPPLEDGYVYVGSLKVQIVDNLLQCPMEGCNKNFRNSNLLQMHIKHYHRELKPMLGITPKVLDLAYARTTPIKGQIKKKPKRPRVLKPKRKPEFMKLDKTESEITLPTNPEMMYKLQDSPKLRDALSSKPVKRPRVLLPVRRPEDLINNDEVLQETVPDPSIPPAEPLDFETAISTHTVTKPLLDKSKKVMKFATVSQKHSEDEEWLVASDVDTRSTFPGSGTPDSKTMDVKQHQAMSSESNNEEKDSNMYTYNECGEKIKIVHMKREEIINCHCGFREEDGLMVQCELCLCWQHALCHNIQNESQVPEKYTCSICLNPRRGRKSRRFAHEQDMVFNGIPAGGRPLCSLRRAHELSGNLLRLQDSLHALALNYHVASKKNHPKLYLWAKDWDQNDIAQTQAKFNSDYSDLNIMISALGKENMPIKPDDMKDLDVRLTSDDDGDRFREGQTVSNMLSGLLSSPGGASLDLPLSASELEKLAKSVEEQELVRAPQPEAAIDNNVCRERLLRHITRCQALLDARLDSIEAQVAELESEDPSFEDDETADYFPRTKQTVQMLLRDLDTMEELALVT